MCHCCGGSVPNSSAICATLSRELGHLRRGQSRCFFQVTNSLRQRTLRVRQHVVDGLAARLKRLRDEQGVEALVQRLSAQCCQLLRLRRRATADHE